MKSVLLKLLRIVSIYVTIIFLFLLIGLIAKIDLAIFLEPFKYIMLFDLIHFYVLDSGKEVFTPQRGMIAFGVNIVLISTAHFLALLPRKASLRKALTITAASVIVLWYILFLLMMLVAAAAGV